MIFYDFYQASEAASRHLLDSARLGRLVTRRHDGALNLGLYPYVHRGGCIEVHLHRDDEQVLDLRTTPDCLFSVDEVLAFIPSHWEHPSSAAYADHYYRLAEIRGRARVVEDPEVLVEHLAALLSRHQPDGTYTPLTEDPPGYLPFVRRLVLVQIPIEAVRTKFKLGQQRPGELRRAIAARLAEEGSDLHLRTRDAVLDALE
jgi:predicted FMN-binding regulatory protein PaiB